MKVKFLMAYQRISLKLVILFCLITTVGACQNGKSSIQIHTVNGAINSSKLGLSLTHEHIMSNYGKDINQTSQYDSLKLFKQVIPYLRQLKASGVNSIFDCTTAYFGRRIDLLQSISDSTGIQFITNTGFYGAANDRYIPEFAYEASADSIAEIWINEFKKGVEGTKIKPGFVKLAFDDDARPSAIDKKLFEAGILTHLSTGLTLAVHTGKNIEALEFQQKLLNEYHVDPSACIWTHANKIEEAKTLLDYAAKGRWISLDGVNMSNTSEYIKRLKLFKEKNLLNKVLLSHDGNGFPSGGDIRPFDAIFNDLIPEMFNNGFTQEDVDQLLVINPQEAFKVRTRRQ